MFIYRLFTEIFLTAEMELTVNPTIDGIIAATDSLESNLVTNATPVNGPNPEIVSFRYFGIVVAVYAIVVGSIGNLLTILAFFSNRKLRTTFNVFVVNLSVVDFLTASAMLPFNLAGYVQMQWPFGNSSFTTRLQAFFYFCCGYTSVVFLVAITINRFIGVFQPTRYEELFKQERLVLTMVVCWTFAPICLLPFLVGTDSSCSSPGQALTGYHAGQFLCTFVCLPKIGWYPYMQFTRVVFQFLPLGVMILAYGSIFYKLRNKAEQLIRTRTMSLQSTQSTSLSVNGELNPALIKKDKPGSVKMRAMMQRRASNTDMKRNKENKRMLLISVAICVGFMVTFLPSVIINLIPGSGKFDPRLHMMASNLSWFNSSINPVIYVILNRRFRKEYIRLIKMGFGRVKGSFVHESTSAVHQRQVSNGKSPKKEKSCSNYSSSVAVNENLMIQDKEPTCV
ncbi:G-protein coupled receptor 84-like isoform X2 [Clavelina lepadiformis]|uniref:G-protein coupled receptor 84-like isoform X2 n=1 Tax=Clavelina lepadiformis TaxID=159417 RepID=UPI004041FF81